MSLISQMQLGQKDPARARIVGIYGVPGSGKSFYLNQLKLDLGQDQFDFYEGSEVIDLVTPGGLGAFQALQEQDKYYWRQLAIDKIKQECTVSGRVGVVAGHFMFWLEEEVTGRPVHTDNDLKAFTHIVYLDTPSDLVVQRRQADPLKSRPPVSEEHLLKWQHTEKTELRRLCRENNILFYVWSTKRNADTLSRVLGHFHQDNNGHNLLRCQTKLDEAISKASQGAETVLVLDGDKTLVAEDTGTLFWKVAVGLPGAQPQVETCPLQALFSSPLGYSDTAFRQASLLYDEIAEVKQFEAICIAVASSITMHPEFVTLLKQVAQRDHVIAVVITCGLRLIWEKVLESAGLTNSVTVIGGGNIADGMVVTPRMKADLVVRLRDVYQLYVWVFGDSPLDLPMMSEAHQSIIVVGEEHNRSKSMDVALLEAIDNQGLTARQVLLPGHASPRLNTEKLPLVHFAEQNFINSILRHRTHQFLDCVNPDSAKLLATKMRDASLSGPPLRAVHQQVGWHLAITFLPFILGLEKHSIPHVQGHTISGHRLQHEQKTLIVALMRGGEAMAFGVNEAFPLAMFLHANAPEDIRLHHVQDYRAIVLVDSVVNSGKTLKEFVKHIRMLHVTIDIVVVAGVVQAKSTLVRDANLVMVALRRSDNKFTGKGTTDTGNRLFNTAHLD